MALCHEALNLSYLNPGLTGLIGAPTYRTLEDSTKVSMVELLEENEIPYRHLKSENALLLHDVGSKILFRSMEEPERLRSMNLAWFGVDELTYCKEKSWLRLLGRVRHPKARVKARFGVWTPNGFDWVYSKFIGPNRLNGYEAILARPGENKAVLASDPDYYERLRGAYTEKFFRQEVLGEYLSLGSGAVYYAFDRGVHVKPVLFNPLKPVYWSLDFNVDPMCSVIFQLDDTNLAGLLSLGPRIQKINVIDELYLENSHDWEACEQMWNKVSAWTMARPVTIRIFGDASGNSRQTTGSSDWQMVRSWLSARGSYVKYSIEVPEGNPLVKNRVNAVNSMLKSMDGEVRISIHPRCKHLVRDLEEVVWKELSSGRPGGDIDKDRDATLTHVSDAFGYGVFKLFGQQLFADTRKPLPGIPWNQ